MRKLYEDVSSNGTRASEIKLVEVGNGKLFPCAPAGSVLWSSAPLGWRGIIVEGHRLDPQEMPAHYLGGRGLMVSTSKQAVHLRLMPAEGMNPKAGVTVVVNSLGQLNHLQLAAVGLDPGRKYELYLVSSRSAPFRERQILAAAQANPSGAIILQALGPL